MSLRLSNPLHRCIIKDSSRCRQLVGVFRQRETQLAKKDSWCKHSWHTKIVGTNTVGKDRYD